MPEALTEADLDRIMQRYREGIARTLVKSGFQAFLVGDLRAQLKVRRALRNGLVRFGNAEKKPRMAGRPRTAITFKGMSRQSAAYLQTYEKDLVERGGTVIKGKFIPWLADRTERVRGSIAATIREGLENGWSNDTLGKALGEIMDQEGRAMTMIAHTEMARIEAAGARSRYHDLGIMKVIWNNGPTPCDICIEFSGNEYDLNDLPEEIPVHNSCACDLVPVIEIPPDEALLLEEDEIADMLAMIPATGAIA